VKKLIQGIAVLMASLSISGCSKIVYTHEQVMLSYHTKNDVIKQFGYPDQRREVRGTTEWGYNCDSASTLFNSKTKIAVNSSYNGVPDSLKTVNVNEFTNYAKYVRFTFDERGNVLKYDSGGVSFVKRKANPAATVLVVLGSVAATVLLLTALINLNDLPVW